jgi:hypothetical protein
MNRSSKLVFAWVSNDRITGSAARRLQCKHGYY